MDIATSFCLHQNVSAINKLLLKDLTSTIYSEIDQLNSTDRKIAILFLSMSITLVKYHEFSIYQEKQLHIEK